MCGNKKIRKYTSIFNFQNKLISFQVDSNQIVARLMQIRDYIKQASTMKNTLQRSQDSVSSTRSTLSYFFVDIIVTVLILIEISSF